MTNLWLWGIGAGLIGFIAAFVWIYRLREQAFLDRMKLLSADVLRANSDDFLKLASERLLSEQALAKQDLAAKGDAIKSMLTPLEEMIRQYQAQTAAFERDRALEKGKVSEQLSMLFTLSQGLQKETANLVNALKKPDVRGNWGELQLRRVVELAGMNEHCDFVVQDSVSTEEGRYRPDMIIHLPHERTIVVDSKAVMSAYLEAVESTTVEARRIAMSKHARQVRDQVAFLSSKNYAQKYGTSLDFVVCFLPGEAFLYAACEDSPQLIEEAMKKNVVIATPTTLIALLKVIALGWRQEDLAKNAALIGEQATELVERLAVSLEHLSGHGEHLAKSIASYNRLIGSIDQKVMPQAERMIALGLQPTKALPELVPIDAVVRESRSNGENTIK